MGGLGSSQRTSAGQEPGTQAIKLCVGSGGKTLMALVPRGGSRKAAEWEFGG